MKTLFLMELETADRRNRVSLGIFVEEFQSTGGMGSAGKFPALGCGFPQVQNSGVPSRGLQSECSGNVALWIQLHREGKARAR